MHRVDCVIKSVVGKPDQPPPGIGTGAGFAAAIGAALLAVAVGGTRHPTTALAVFALATVLVALRFRLPDGLATAVMCWLFMNGFLLNREGELSWHGPQDAARMAVLVAAALAARAVGGHVRHRHGGVPPTDQLTHEDLRPAA